MHRTGIQLGREERQHRQHIKIYETLPFKAEVLLPIRFG